MTKTDRLRVSRALQKVVPAPAGGLAPPLYILINKRWYLRLPL